MVARLKVKFIVDILMFIDLLVLATSGFILKFVYPAGEMSGRMGVKFLFDRFGWLEVHDITSYIIVGLVIIHLTLNWPFIKTMFKRK